MGTGPTLRKWGFDQSYYSRQAQRWVVKCSQCAAMIINGTPCHEQGCPNQGR